MEKLRLLVETYIDYQKDRIRLENRLRSLPSDAREDFFKELADDAHVLEKEIQKRIAELVKEEALYDQYLRYQKGIGTTMASYLIGWLAKVREIKIFGVTKKVGEGKYNRRWKGKTETLELPPYATILEENLTKKPKYIRVHLPAVMEVADHPSDLSKYCGLAPLSKLKRGEHAAYSPKLKTLMWKIFRQLLMARGEWARIAEKDKKEYGERAPEPDWGTRKLKVHLTTEKIVMRKFMTNLWLVYRKQNGLSVTEPYPTKLGHTNILKPFLETEKGIEPYEPAKVAINMRKPI